MTDNDFIEALLFKETIREQAPGLAERRQAAIDWLAERWLLHPSNAPRKREDASDALL
jgi:hypothetical protein